MARYKPGPLGVQEMGKVGGVVFSLSASGPTVKAWRMPVNKRRAIQIERRTALATQSSRWFAELSTADRIDWEDYALTVDFIDSLGDTYQITGHQMFVRTQCILAQIPIGPQDLAPSLPGLPTARSFTIALNHATGVVNLNGVVPAGLNIDRIYAFVNNFDKVTRKSPRGRRVATAAMVADIALPVVLHTFPAPLPGSAGDYKVWVTFYYYDSDNRFTKPIVVSIEST